MGFDEEEQVKQSEDKKPIHLFGLELGNGAVYTFLAILTLVFIRQVYVVLQALP